MKLWHILIAALPLLIPLLRSVEHSAPAVRSVLHEVPEVVVRNVPPDIVPPSSVKVLDSTATHLIAPVGHADEEKATWQPMLRRVRERPDSVQYFSASEIDLAPLAKFDHPIALEQPIVSYAVIPDTAEEFMGVFGFKASVADLDSMRRAKKQFQDLSANPGFPRSARELGNVLSNSNSTVFTFSGHNANGALVLTDGSTIELEKIAELCVEHQKICVFLSCHSERFVSRAGVETAGVTYSLTLAQAAETIESISRFVRFAAANDGTYRDVVLAIPVITMSYHARNQIKRGMAYIGAGGAGLGLIVVINERKS